MPCPGFLHMEPDCGMSRTAQFSRSLSRAGSWIQGSALNTPFIISDLLKTSAKAATDSCVSRVCLEGGCFDALCKPDWGNNSQYPDGGFGNVVNIAAALEVVQGLLWTMPTDAVLDAADPSRTASPTSTAVSTSSPTPTQTGKGNDGDRLVVDSWFIPMILALGFASSVL